MNNSADNDCTAQADDALIPLVKLEDSCSVSKTG